MMKQILTGALTAAITLNIFGSGIPAEAAPAGSNIAATEADASQSSTIQYNNNVFTKKLYKKTKKIGFGSDGSMIAKDAETVKKVYALLAKMKLEINEDPHFEASDGFTAIVIYTKAGNKKTYTFAGGCMHRMKKSYQIIKHNPIKKIRKIYESII